MKNLFNLIVKNKWHLHSITFALCYFGLFITTKYPKFMSIGESGKFLQGFLCVLCSACLAFIVEWVQGAFYGANKTPSELDASNKDMLVSFSAGVVGMITYFIFN